MYEVFPGISLIAQNSSEAQRHSYIIILLKLHSSLMIIALVIKVSKVQYFGDILCL